MRRTKTLVLALGALMILLSVPPARLTANAQSTADDSNYQLIVHPANPNASVSRGFIARAFLKKTRTWPSGSSLEPVDQGLRTGIRRQFSLDLLGRSVESVWSHWQHMVFSGRGLPPPQLDSDDQVVRFVLSHPGGIGYVSSKANLRGAKPLRITVGN